MKLTSIIGYISLTMVIFVQFSCTKKVEKSLTTNEFIEHLLDENSIQLYKSEIQRVKVNFFPGSNMLFYSFWKKEKFMNNGDLFLHLYPSDSNDLIEKRRKHKFVNLPIPNSTIVQGYPPFFFVIQNLQLPFDLSAIKTGQYNKTGKTWNADFKNRQILKKDSQYKEAFRSGKISTLSSIRIDNFSSINKNLLLGAKIYESKQNSLVSVFFNANLNRVSYFFNDFEKKDWSNVQLYIDVFGNDEKQRGRKILSLDNLKLNESIGVLSYDLPLNANFERLVIGQKENEIEEVWKVLEKKELIYTSYLFSLSNNNTALLNLDDTNIALVNNLITCNLPLVYYNFEKDFGLYLNQIGEKAYLVSYNVDNFDNQKLNCTMKQKDKFTTEDLKLQDAFYIEGKDKQIVIYELILPDGAMQFQLGLNSDKKILFERIIEPVGNK